MLECTAPGGQAATSMRIENYLGFPTGVTGSEPGETCSQNSQKVTAAPGRALSAAFPG